MDTDSPLDLTVPDLLAGLESGRLRREELISAFEARLAALDEGDHPVRAVLDRLPDPDRPPAPGPLEGLPILVKGNIAVAGLEGVSCTAGSLALEGFDPPNEATVVGRLRAAGAVVMGTTNLSEWANFRSMESTSGWSARGGLTLNPHGRGLTACGSSSGSAAAVAGGLVRVALGTETDGSICCPASVCGVVGWKPTVGTVPTDGVIPISHRQDSVGVLAASMADLLPVAEVLLGGTLQGMPPLHPGRTADPEPARGVAGLRIGVADSLFEAEAEIAALMDSFVATAGSQGIQVVREVTVPQSEELNSLEFALLLQEFHHGVDLWLSGLPQVDRPADLAALIEFNREHSGAELRWFGQDLFEAAVETPPLLDGGYDERVERALRLAERDGLRAEFERHGLDVLAVPVERPAGRVELGRPHPGGGFGAITASAVAGWPVLTLPLGRIAGLPVGMGLIAPPGSDPFLLRVGAVLEPLLPWSSEVTGWRS